LALVRSEVAGSVWKIAVEVGAVVSEGDVVVTVESMKMEIEIEAPCTGIVREIYINEGEVIAEGVAVMNIE
jgi:biotin carboxyl carrier protein